MYLHLRLRCDVGRERTFRQSLSKLKEEVVRANAMVREANFLAHEMSKKTEFSVTLQIPAANLTPNRKVGHNKLSHNSRHFTTNFCL